MIIKLFTLILSLAVSVNSQLQCGISGNKSKCSEDVNSKVQLAEDGQWPWAAALYLKDGNHKQYLCSGTLISDQYVLTGKSCMILDQWWATCVPRHTDMSYWMLWCAVNCFFFDMVSRALIQGSKCAFV